MNENLFLIALALCIFVMIAHKKRSGRTRLITAILLFIIIFVVSNTTISAIGVILFILYGLVINLDTGAGPVASSDEGGWLHMTPQERQAEATQALIAATRGLEESIRTGQASHYGSDSGISNDIDNDGTPNWLDHDNDGPIYIRKDSNDIDNDGTPNWLDHD